MKQIIPAVLLVVLGLVGSPAYAATYFVDFDGGADGNDGTTATTPFKHCPGDTAATDKAAGVTLQAGDVVTFKGGVRYHGSITVAASGEKDKPILLDGNTAGSFGAGAAIIEGAEPIAGWKKCTSSDDALGNPNFDKLFYTDQVPAGINVWAAGPYENDQPLFLEENPTANPDLFWWDITEKAIRSAVPTKEASGSETLTDDYFNQSDAHFWDGAYITLHANPNLFYPAPVTAFDPAAHKITFKQPGAVKYYTPGSKQTWFFMLNTLPRLDKPGQYTLTPINGATRIYCWPNNPDTFPTTATIAARNRAISLTGNFITVRGFIVQHLSEMGSKGPKGIEGTGSNLTIQDNEVRWLRDRYSDRSPAISLEKSNDSAMIGNKVHDNIKCIGIIFHTCERGVAKDNVLHKNGDTAADFYTCKSIECTHNLLTESLGMHANGLTFYVNCSDIKVEGNNVTSTRPLTFANIENLRVVNNVFDSMGNANAISTWPGVVKNADIEYNTLVHANLADAWSGSICNLEPKAEGYVVRNNIMERVGGAPGASAVSTDNNLMLGTDAKPEDVFVDYAKGDYHLKAGSAAIGKGKSSDVKTDIDGNARPDQSPDLGAYQFQAGKN